MKKTSLEVLSQLCFGLISVALMVGGAIAIIASFFTPTPLFYGIICFALGAILFCAVKIYFMFLETLKVVTKAVESNKMTNTIIPNMQGNVEYISINENTTQEEIEAIKQKHPELANAIDHMVHQMDKNDIKTMSIIQLEKQLKEAVDNNEFEKAAQIRDEIKRRKL